MTNKPASSALRALAYLVEASYGLLFTMIFVLLIVSQPTLALAAYYLFMFLILYFLNPLIIYNSIVLTHYFGGSIGKLFTGLRVVDENGTHLSFKRIAFRQTVGYGFSGILFGLGFAAIIKDGKKQGWHDKAVGSQVIVTQNLWPVALLFTILTLGGSAYLGLQSFERVMSGPLYNEVVQIWQQMETEQAERKASKEAAEKPPMISPPLISPTSTRAL